MWYLHKCSFVCFPALRMCKSRHTSNRNAPISPGTHLCLACCEGGGGGEAAAAGCSTLTLELVCLYSNPCLCHHHRQREETPSDVQDWGARQLSCHCSALVPFPTMPAVTSQFCRRSAPLTPACAKGCEYFIILRTTFFVCTLSHAESLCCEFVRAG